MCPLCGAQVEAHACSNVPPLSARDYIEAIVVDTGGIGKIVAEELSAAGFNVVAKLKRGPSIDGLASGVGRYLDDAQVRARRSTEAFNRAKDLVQRSGDLVRRSTVDANRKGGGW